MVGVHPYMRKIAHLFHISQKTWFKDFTPRQHSELHEAMKWNAGRKKRDYDFEDVLAELYTRVLAYGRLDTTEKILWDQAQKENLNHCWILDNLAILSVIAQDTNDTEWIHEICKAIEIQEGRSYYDESTQ